MNKPLVYFSLSLCIALFWTGVAALLAMFHLLPAWTIVAVFLVVFLVAVFVCGMVSSIPEEPQNDPTN